jgi:hypothetical protein
LGATTIRTADRAPDEINTRIMELRWQYAWAYTRKTFDYSLGGYSHRERWSRTRWRINLRRTMKNYFEKNDEELLQEERWRITLRRMMKNYFEKNDEELLWEERWRITSRRTMNKLLREERGRKIRVHYRCQAPQNKLNISLPSGEICD